jgi:hypothetical protein
MSLLTIRTTCLSACKHNVFCDGVYSWMTIQSNSTTSKEIATRLQMLCRVYLLMRSRKPMLRPVTMTITNTIHKRLQAHASWSWMVIQFTFDLIKTNDIYHQLYGSLDLFQPLAMENNVINCSPPYVGEYSLHTYVCKYCTGSAWGCSAAAAACTKAQSIYTKTIGTQLIFMVLSKSPRPTLAQLRHAQKRSNVVSPRTESCGSSSINGHNVNDIL